GPQPPVRLKQLGQKARRIGRRIAFASSRLLESRHNNNDRDASMRKLLLALLILVPLGAAIFFTLPSLLDRQMNSVANAPPYAAGDEAQQLHRRLFVADLHDDALLWQRDLLERHDYGHSDLPRLLEGRVGLQ